MGDLFLLLVLVALVLLFIGLGPFLRVRAFLAENRPDTGRTFSVMGNMLKDPAHPLHGEMQTVAYTYGGFIVCVLLGGLIGVLTFPRI